LPPGRRDRLTLALTTFGLGLGGLTLWMFWIALLWPGRLGLLPALVGVGGLGALGVGLARGDLRPDPAPPPGADPGDGVLRATLAVVVVLHCGAIVLNAAVWPFRDWDALALYAPTARTVYRTGALPAATGPYEGYPMLVPLAYAYTHWAVGAVNEYVARLVPALMAVGAVGAAAALGREMGSPAAGRLAASLVVLTPVFCHWASSGYVDVPTAYYVVLSALFVWRWWRDGHGRDALLAGLTGGLAMWTKNAALTLLPSFAALVLVRWWLGRRGSRAGGTHLPGWGQVGLLVGATGSRSAPWCR
jgi:hypothetical protein